MAKSTTPLHVNAEVNWILIGSAVLCITLAHVLYYFAIREIGVALSQTLQLLSPLGALALSAWIFHERLSPAQLWCAGGAALRRLPGHAGEAWTVVADDREHLRAGCHPERSRGIPMRELQAYRHGIL